MMQCDVCNEWYHHACIGFVGNEEDAQELDFHCMKCMKFEPAETREARLEVGRRFFKEDSVFLNWIPQTPDLSYEEHDNKELPPLEEMPPMQKEGEIFQ